MSIWPTVSFSLALAVSTLLLVLPTYSSGATLVQMNGSRVMVPLAFPVVVALLPLLLRRRAVAIGAAVVLSAFCLVAGFSIGLFYIPSAVTMIVASVRFRRKGQIS